MINMDTTFFDLKILILPAVILLFPSKSFLTLKMELKRCPERSVRK